MTRVLVINPEVDIDIREIEEWYEARQPGLSRTFAAELHRSIQSIIDRPFSFSRVGKEVRRAPIARFPHGIFFECIEPTIYVLGVFHGRTSPTRWIERSG